jgi:cytoskeleton-associated protein 5
MLQTSKKWQERKEAMEQLLNVAKTPKIADRDYSELMSALAKVGESRLCFDPSMNF